MEGGRGKVAIAVVALLSSGMVAGSSIAKDEDASDPRASGPTVQTAEGPVRGFENNGVYEFLGIPYAAPPVGALRWQPPQPVQHWQKTKPDPWTFVRLIILTHDIIKREF